jgi:formamidopyrimidine-DNA glycosylase
LLDQTVCAGIGNYLRAEILLLCKVNPWARIADLTVDELECLNHEIPRVAALAYANNGATANEEQRERMRLESGLTYAPGREYGTRHLAFRRTNLPCLVCGDTIRQKRQVTRVLDDEEKSRIIYFCPTCQNVNLEEKPKRAKRTIKPAVD